MRHFELGEEAIYFHRKKTTRIIGVKTNNSGLTPLYLIENPKGFVLDSLNLESLVHQPHTEYLELKEGERYSWISHNDLGLPEDSLYMQLQKIKEEIK